MDVELVERAAAEKFRRPPRRKVDCPIVDIHAHSMAVDTAAPLYEAARLYGITRLAAIATLETGLELQKAYPETEIIPFLDFTHVSDPGRFAEVNVGIVRRAQAAGARLIKLWFAPRFIARTGLRLDDPRLDPIFAEIDRLGLGVLVHVSDPDVWFERVYTDRALYGTKADQYAQLVARLAAHPRIPFLAAHMGGDPEHLDHLAQLLEQYPNLYLDTSATKWIVRELGKQPDAARAFFQQFKDRILFGTDQVAIPDPEPNRYTSRYWIHTLFWETDTVCPLPIEDPDSDGPPVLRGIDLPADVLPWIYYVNAQRVFGVPPAKT
ncbi:MAG: amidohydrolase family protein [Firmicutes bacterium]|nr:amidohydrolase family protein [Bacillota bacterium]